MKKIAFLTICFVILLFSGCGYYGTTQQEGGVSYIPIEEIVEEGQAEPEEGAALEEIDEIMPPEEIAEEAEEISEEEITEVIEGLEEGAEPAGETEEAIVIIVEETELVSLVPTANDPDADLLAYTFTSPLNENGEWQTTYGNAGEYTVAITASDGELTTSKDVLVIVNKKEEAPVIDDVAPEETALETDENTAIDFSVKASDLNKDELTYSWKLDGAEVSAETSYKYAVTYDDAGSHTVKLDIFDGALTTTKIWAVTANNINREPVLEELSGITAKETETVAIEARASDPDGDGLIYTISEPVGDDGIWETTYDDAGTYTVTVAASDGELEDSQKLTVTIKNVNRPPVITDVVRK